MIKILRYLFLVLLLGNSLSAFEYNRAPAGLIKGCRAQYLSTTAIKLGVGYGESAGSYWEITATHSAVTTGYTLSSLTSSTNGLFHYIYVDRSASSFPDVVLIDSTTAPAWSDDFMGWYNGLDRCIAVVWSNPDGTLRNFFCSDDETYLSETPATSTSGSIDTSGGTWYTVDINAFTPVNTSEVRLMIEGWNTSWSNCTIAMRRYNHNFNIKEHGVKEATLVYWMPFERNADRKYMWMAYASSSSVGALTRYVYGYKIER